jgi:hypothetical protein
MVKKIPIFLKKVYIYQHPPKKLRLSLYDAFILKIYHQIMKTRYFFILLTIPFCVLFVGCDKECSPEDCVETMLAQYGMVPYTGQTQYCNSLTLYEYKNRQYFSEDCCICDMLPNATDCDNNNYFMTNGEFDEIKYTRFFALSRKIGIVGVME